MYVINFIGKRNVVNIVTKRRGIVNPELNMMNLKH